MRKLLLSIINILFFVVVINYSLSAQKAIKVTYQKLTDQEGYLFYAENSDIVPYVLKLNFTELINLVPNKSLSSYTPTIYPQDKQEILKLVLKKNAPKSSFNFNYLFSVGESDKKPDDSFLYLLPYKHGEKVKVGQGYNGNGTHKGVNAIDFNLNIGEEVYAARDGLVFDVKEDSYIGGYDPKYDNKGNYISVYHEDGTIGKYVHLKQNGVLVEKGEKIKAGQRIGISGNTGYSSGPHLHFVVTANENFSSKTLPIKYLNYKSEGFIPQAGYSYYAYHPGKEEFAIEDEENFKLEDFKENSSPSELNREFRIDSQEYGNYVILYANNGYKNNLKGTLNIDLTNMECINNLPYQFESSAKTREFLTVLKPTKVDATYSYKVSVTLKNN